MRFGLLLSMLLLIGACSEGAPEDDASHSAVPTVSPEWTQPSVSTTPAPPFHVIEPLREGHLILEYHSTSVIVVDGDRISELLGPMGEFSYDGAYVTVGSASLAVQESTTGEAVELPEASSAVHRGVWSPVDDRIAYAGGDSVYVTHVPSGGTLRYAVPDGAHPLAWSAQGSALVLLREPDYRTRLSYLLNLSDGTVTALPKEADFNSLAPSPDGRYVAYAVGSWLDGWQMGLFDAQTGKTCLVRPAAALGWESAQKAPFTPEWSADSLYALYTDERWRSAGFANAHVTDAASCIDTVLPRPVRELIWSPESSPSGHTLAAIVAEMAQSGNPDSQHTQLALWTPRDGLKAIAEGGDGVRWASDSQGLRLGTGRALRWLSLTGVVQKEIAFGEDVDGAVLSPSGRYLAVQDSSRTRLHVVDLEAGSEQVILDGPGGWFVGAWTR